MRVVNRRRHQHVGLIRSKTKHQTLVPRALVGFIGLVGTERNVRRLLTNGIDDRTGVAIEAHVGGVKTDVQHGFTNDFLQLAGGHVTRRCDLSCHHHHAGFDKRLNGDPRIGVFGQVGIQNGIGNLIRHFVGVPFRHRFRCEK